MDVSWSGTAIFTGAHRRPILAIGPFDGAFPIVTSIYYCPFAPLGFWGILRFCLFHRDFLVLPMRRYTLFS